MDKNKKQIINPGLYLVSTPIGNMEDITLRALNILKNQILFYVRIQDDQANYFLICKSKVNFASYHKFNEKKVSKNIIESIRKNKIVSLISDAGTPTISDPGIILVNKCIKENLNVYPVPGSSAVTSAVAFLDLMINIYFMVFYQKKKMN